MSDGWNCPKCGSAHAPSVQTCPVNPPVMPVGIPNVWPSQPMRADCGCKPLTVCMNVACPRRLQVTYLGTSMSDLPALTFGGN